MIRSPLGIPLILLTLFTITVIVFRGITQDLTIDEVYTYQIFLEPRANRHWYPAANNHLLSTLLIQAAVELFGISPTAIRLPAMLSGVVFCSATAVLVAALISHHRTVARLILFSLLALNPFTLDYLVAARGYAPALALLMAVLAVLFLHWQQGRRPPLALLSTLAGLAVAANYTFLFVMGALLGGIALATLGEETKPGVMALWRRALNMAAPAFLPFLLVLGLLCGDNLVNMSKYEIGIGWGTERLDHWIVSMAEQIFLSPSPFMTPPHLRVPGAWLATLVPWVTVALIVIGAIIVAWMTFHRHWRAPQHRLLMLSALALLLATLAHLVLFHGFGIKLPRSRTGIYAVPLLTLIAAAPLFLDWRLLRTPALTACGGIVLSFLLAMRFSHFQEWKWGADTCAVIEIAGDYAKAKGITRIDSVWDLAHAGNFYRDYLGYDFEPLEFPPAPKVELRTDGQIYLLSHRTRNFVQTLGLRVIYTSPVAASIVAVRDPDPANDPPRRMTLYGLRAESRCHHHAGIGDRDAYPGPDLY